MNKTRIIVAWLQLALILFLSVPRELIHEMHHCNDTVDVPRHSGNTVNVSTEHHHCEILQLDAPAPFHHVVSIVFNVTFHRFDFKIQEYKNFFSRIILTDRLRGPPSVI